MPSAAIASTKSRIKGAVKPPVEISRVLAKVAIKEAKIKLKLVML